MEAVKKCSRCGLCAQVCPIYEVEKNEVCLARGKFLQLLGVLRGELKLNKKIERNLKFCLNCGKCTKNCPSAIDTIGLFSQIKNHKTGGGERWFNFKLLPIKFLNLFSRKKIELESGELYFKGCLSDKAVVSSTPACANQKSSFKCCAIPFFVDGRLDIYEKMVEHNLKIIEDENVKKVYFDCATCFNAVKNYPFRDPKNIEKLEILFEQGCDEKFTFFKPCHMDMPQIDSPNYIPLEIEQCCGFGGDFFLKHPIVAHKLSIKLAKQIKNLGVKAVVAPCPTCVWSIAWGSFCLRNKIKIFGS